jgi:hypothetical protein
MFRFRKKMSVVTSQYESLCQSGTGSGAKRESLRVSEEMM